MTCPIADTICVARGVIPTLMARIEAADENDDSVPIVQGDVATIRYTVVDITNGGTETVGGTLQRTNVIYNTLQTGDIWTVDDEGYNFKHKLPTAAIDEDDHQYVAEYVITLVNGDVLPPLHFPISGQKMWLTEPSS